MPIPPTTHDDARPLYSSGQFAAITPHDDNDIAGNVRALFISATGTLSLMNGAGNAVPFGTVTAGTLLPVSPKRVRATGTTATVIGLF